MRVLGLFLMALLGLASPVFAAFDAGDIICETSTTTGTGTLNLAGAVTNYATFVSQITSGSTVNYHISASDGKLETGVGVLTDATPDTLTRVAYWSSDGSGAELNLPAGTHTVCLGPTTQMFAGMRGFQLYNDDAGAVGGILPFWHDSASPSAGDAAADIQVYAGTDDEEVGRIVLEVDDGGTGSEDTQWRFFTDVAGASTQKMTIGQGVTIGVGTALPGVGNARLYTNDAGAQGPSLQMHHDSTSSADGDVSGEIQVYGGADDELIGQFQLEVDDGGTGSEDTYWRAIIREAGTDTNAFAAARFSADLGHTFVTPVGINLDNQNGIYFFEAEAGGDNSIVMQGPAAITSDQVCTFENDSHFIPDSCVGDGVDASDARLKDNLKPIGDVGALLDQIKIYDFTWNADSPKSEAVQRGKHGVGPVAQELFKVNPDWVHVGGDDPINEPWTWKPERLVPYLIAEVQNLRKRSNPTCYGIQLGSACVGVSM